VESSTAYRDRYIFIGKTRGGNFNALQQWAEGFSVLQDFPRLAAARIESRLIAAASLYPDDEYGEYFEALVKRASDSEYPGAVKEAAYWIKTKVIQQQNNDDADPDEINEPLVLERYEFFILISIDKATLQNNIRELMINIKTGVAPTRAQEAAISRVQQSFFGGF
jgi:Asp-tRNA(Asn)/Glu-tRNA(Gln) amidotransferase B subunit